MLCVLCCQVEVSRTGRLLVQRSPTECGLCECDGKASIMRATWPTRPFHHGIYILGVYIYICGSDIGLVIRGVD